jgi:uncharacterized protein YndB with AHSA1/START domain
MEIAMIAENTVGLGLRKQAVFMTRFFLRAPRDVVFDALVEPAQLSRWCGPQGFATSVCEVELWEGGGHRTVLRGPEAEEIALRGTYREVCRPVRLVYTERFDIEADASQEHVVSITLTERDGGTELALIERLQIGSERAAKVRVGAWESNFQSVTRLREHVESLPTQREQDDPDEEWAFMPFECDDRVQISRPSGIYGRAGAVPARELGEAPIPVARAAGRRGAFERLAALFRVRS